MNEPVISLELVQAAGSHFDVGRAMGQRFADKIHLALDRYDFFQQQLLPFHRTAEGQRVFSQMLEINRARYPDYIYELEGLAQGAGRDFDELFLVNARGEYAAWVSIEAGRGCSDCAVVAAEAALIGHNEDADPAFRGNMYLVRAQVENKPTFTALAYPGFLCGNAFGMNDAGICFSVDHVRPEEIRPGLARQFIARSLLEARSIDDAIARVTAPGRASGFSYTVGSTIERRVVVVEVAPETHHVHEVQGCYFHTNHYRRLDAVRQQVHPSSRARLERADQLLTGKSWLDVAGVLGLLGDEGDHPYPIYRTATPPDGSVTHCTTLFDLDARLMRIYTTHPLRHPQAFVVYE